MKALKWALGDWRLWVIAAFCLWALGGIARLVSMPITMHVKIEGKGQTEYKYTVMEDTQTVATFAPGDPWTLSDHLFIIGGLRVRMTGDVMQDMLFAQQKIATKITLDFQASPWFAIAVMALSGLLAVWWMRSWESAWRWQPSFIVISLFGYTTLSGLATDAIPTGAQNFKIFPDIFSSMLHIVVTGALAGGVALVLSRWFPREMVMAAGKSLANRTQEYVHDPKVQQTMRNTVTGISTASAQAVRGINDALSSVATTSDEESGWLCCPKCGNRDKRLFGHGKYPNKLQGTRCSMCQLDLSRLEIDYNNTCVTCKKPMVVEAFHCHHCSTNQRAPEPPKLPPTDSEAWGECASAIPSTLNIVSGASAGQSFKLTDGKAFYIGRATTAQLPASDGDSPSSVTVDVVLDADQRTSRLHAVINRDELGCWISDLNSANGTYVDGVRINVETPLVRGTTVRIGDTVIKME